MLSDIRTTIYALRAENSAFLRQNRVCWQSACYEFRPVFFTCQESREGLFALQ